MQGCAYAAPIVTSAAVRWGRAIARAQPAAAAGATCAQAVRAGVDRVMSRSVRRNSRPVPAHSKNHTGRSYCSGALIKR